MARYTSKLYNLLPPSCPDKETIDKGGSRRGVYECLAEWRDKKTLTCVGVEGENACISCALRIPTFTVHGERIPEDEVTHNPVFKERW